MSVTITRPERALIILILLAAIFLCWCSLYVNLVSRRHIVAADALPRAEVALVLGAAVYSDGTLTQVLEERADAAITLYQQHYVKKILVSGDNSSSAHNEVVPVGKYLVMHGVAKEDIFLDYAGFDTYDSMYRAKRVFQVKSAIIVTQSFHLPRAVYLGRSVGLEAYGYPSNSDNIYLYNYAREYFADAKAIANVLLRSQPTYLGESVPISGKGNTP